MPFEAKYANLSATSALSASINHNPLKFSLCIKQGFTGADDLHRFGYQSPLQSLVAAVPKQRSTDHLLAKNH
jgi:hypothetical protein